MADFGLEGVTKKRLIRFIGNKENWDRRMIEYRLKRALIAETYAAKHHWGAGGVLVGGRWRVFYLLEWVCGEGSLSPCSLGAIIGDDF